MSLSNGNGLTPPRIEVPSDGDIDDPYFPVGPRHHLADTARIINEAVAEIIGEDGYMEAEQAMNLRALGWVLYQQGINQLDRENIVRNSRSLIKRDPLIRNAARIWEAFVIGDGPIWDIRDDVEQSGQGIALRSFIADPRNRPSFRFQGQREAYSTLLSDGELHYIVFFGAVGATPVMRFVDDSLEFDDPITHPEDKTTVLYYVRKFHEYKWKFDSKTGKPEKEVSEDPSYQYIRA